MPNLKKCYLFTATVSYTCIWNLVDFPAGVVPYGQESCQNIDSYDCEGDNILKLAKKVPSKIIKTCVFTMNYSTHKLYSQRKTFVIPIGNQGISWSSYRSANHWPPI